MPPAWISASIFVLAFRILLSAFVPVQASTASTSPDLFSIPISRSNPQRAHFEATHGSIVQQQHINHGVQRLAMMTGQTPPSQDILLFAILQRISRLPKALLRKYHLERVKSNIVIRLASNLRAPTGPGHDVGLRIEANGYGYTAALKIGNPPRDFQLLIDSGSADFWVGGEGCHDSNGNDCGPHQFLGPNSSATCKITQLQWAVGYATGFVSGLLAQDDISIGDLTINNHTFGVALKETKEFTANSTEFDGILGLAKSGISQQGVPPFLHALYQAKLITAPIVSYRIPRFADNKTGMMTLGGMDQSLFDPATLVRRPNINKFGFWGVAVDDIEIGQSDMQWTNRTIILDTGTPLIIAPKKDVGAIHSFIPGARNNGAGWRVPCQMNTSISFIIGGQPFSIDPRDVAFYPLPEEPGYCMSGIAAGGVGPFYLDNEWLVGDVFLKNIYFSTDESRDEVSIAKPLP